MADRRLQVFYTVAKQLSFTKAAEQLFMTQPAVTFQVKQLEEHFNARLFDRTHGKIMLTPTGHMVLEYAERILSLSEELDKRVSEMTGATANNYMGDQYLRGQPSLQAINGNHGMPSGLH